jgi:Tfp pilus assembly protein PilN
MRAVNLIPAEQRSGVSVGVGKSQGAAYAVLALAAGLALMALLYGRANHQIASRRTQAAAITAQAQHASAAAEQLAPYTSFIAMREQREQAVSTLVDSRFDWAHAFHEFGRVLPAQTSISSLTGTIGSGTTAVSAAPSPTTSSSATPPATGAAPSAPATSAAPASAAVASVTPPGSVPSFTVTGCATSQRAVAQTLQRLRLIDGVSDVTLQSSVAGSTGAGGCPPHGPSFNVQVTFDPMPSASATATATKTVSDSGVSAK